MVRPDRASLAHTAPLEDLVALLLRQYRRPLETRGVTLNSADTKALVDDILARRTTTEMAAQTRTALVALVRESEAVLAGWDLTFQTALETGMDSIPGWETTADFLEIANEKSNAELRIAAGATLLAALGDLRYADDVVYLATHDEHDVDSVIARRVLVFVSGVEADVPDWETQVRNWLAAQGTRSSGTS